MVIITNRAGIEYEVSREQAEKMVQNKDIKESDIREITPETPETPETRSHTNIVIETFEKKKPGRPSTK